MPEGDSQNLVIVQMQRPKPLSPVKAADILRVAQRMLDEKGVVVASEVYHRCRPRIPGERQRYGETIHRLACKQQLKPRRRR